MEPRYAGCEPAGCDGVAQPAGHGAQDVVPGEVAVLVVDAFEVVEVDQYEVEWAAGAAMVDLGDGGAAVG
jgi:hypothetical protein